MSFKLKKIKKVQSLPQGHIFGAKWCGNRCAARVVCVRVGRAPSREWWCADLVDEKRLAVEISAFDPTLRKPVHFYVDFEDGAAVRKLTTGKGMPSEEFKVLPVRYHLLDSDQPIATTYKAA